MVRKVKCGWLTEFDGFDTKNTLRSSESIFVISGEPFVVELGLSFSFCAFFSFRFTAHCTSGTTHSGRIPTLRHFFSLHSWHFRRIYMSISQLFPYLHWYTLFLVILRRKKPGRSDKEIRTLRNKSFSNTDKLRYSILKINGKRVRHKRAFVIFGIEYASSIFFRLNIFIF